MNTNDSRNYFMSNKSTNINDFFHKNSYLNIDQIMKGYRN